MNSLAAIHRQVLKMKTIATYINLEITCVDFQNFREKLPEKNWICIAVVNKKPDWDKFEEFVRFSISRNILEFKTQGVFCENLHDWFDDIINIMEMMENHSEIDVMTTWHNDESLSNVMWQALFANCLPETTDLKNLKIVCFDLDGEDRTDELEKYLQKIKRGWLP